MASSSTARPNQTPREKAFDQIAPCSAPKSAKPWDIFINHRGPDVKQTLAANIHHKLHSLGFNVFLDVEALEAGDSIPAEIQHAIASATLHIAIFSPNYAQSPWCLAELSFMLETDKKIIPIFYHVDPSDLRYMDQGKGKYAHAFSEHEKKGRYTPGKLGDWKRALHNSSFLSGYLVNNNEDEATVLKNIVNDALKIMKKDPLWVAEHPLGLDELVKEFESAAGEETVNIRGIVGMGGSGKTTLAKELFNWKSSFFVKCSFVFDVRDAASRDALPDKQKKLLADLGAHHSSFDHVDEGKVVLANYLSSHRAFIVLDDVDHIDQLNALLPNKDNLRFHSLVIVTTRELGVLISWGLPLSCIYRMPGLKWLHARQLFCWHAFLQPSPPAEFETLVEEFLKACNGLPLSLKVLGAQLYGRKSKDYWKSQLHKILRILPGEIQQRLKVSYDALDEEEKEMFLDIACFSIVEEKSTAIAVWDGSGWSGLHGLETLVNKCLVEVVEEETCTRTWSERINRIRMHDHLRDMGREIASRQSPYRLWCPQQIDNMKHSTERKPIRGIQPADSYVAFKKYMHELMPGYYFPNSRDHCSRIYQSHEGSSSTSTNCFGRCLGKRSGRYKYEEPKQGNSIRRSERPQFSNGLQILSVRGNELTEEFATLSEDLVMLFWKDFPLRNVPSWLTLKNLRVLELDGADELEELWQNNADPPLQLSELILRNCRKLQWFPSSIRRLHHLKRLVADFPGSGLTVDCWGLQSLENLRLCSPVISSLPDDFGNFTSLRNINLQYCTALNMLPASFSQLMQLTDLDLSCCEMLSSLPDYFGNLTSLRNIDLCCCKGFNMLPASFSQLIHLIHLDLSDCEMLASLPDDFGNLTSLRKINLYHCKELNMLPASFSQLIHLTDLNLSDCEMLSSLPDDFGNLTSLSNINLQHCNGLNMLPASFSQLIHLTDLNLSGCEMLSSLPDDFGNLTSLRNIYLYYCKRLNMLPASFSQLKHLTDLDLSNCEMLSSLPDDFGNLTSLRNINLYYCKGLNMLPASFSQLIHLTDLNLSYCEMLSSLPETLSIMSLNNLTIIFCNFLKDVRCISGLINLETLEIYDCLQIEELPSFADLPSLKRFEMRNCPKVEKIEGLEHAKSLKKLCVETFWEVPGIQGLENVERLEVLHLKCETISALKPCIQSIKGKECPRRMWIQGSVNHLKESIVNSLELEFSDLEKVIRVPDDSNDSEVSNVWEVDDEDDDEDDDGDDDENDDEDEVEDDDDFSNEGDYYYLYYAEKEKEKSKVVRIWYSVCAPDDHYRLPNRLIVVSGKKQRVAEAFHQLLNLLE